MLRYDTQELAERKSTPMSLKRQMAYDVLVYKQDDSFFPHPFKCPFSAYALKYTDCIRTVVHIVTL